MVESRGEHSRVRVGSSGWVRVRGGKMKPASRPKLVRVVRVRGSSGSGSGRVRPENPKFLDGIFLVPNCSYFLISIVYRFRQK